MQGKLSMVGTPIGNLEDITYRAVRTLGEADVIFCEDTRVTGKLLKHYEINTPLKRGDAYAEKRIVELISNLISEGQHIAYVTDAGTPGVSDPGAVLVAGLRETCPECVIETIPGPSALTATLSVAGVTDSSFTFLGFLPHKKGRETIFKEIAASGRPIVFYESPHRIMKTLTSLVEHAPQARVVLARELTKLHEECLIGTPSELLAILEGSPEKVRGEFVGVVLPE